MHHLTLLDILMAVVWAAGSIGVVYLSGHIYGKSKRHAEYDRRMRRVVFSYWALFCLWQGCLALNLAATRAVWIHYAGPVLITALFLAVIRFPLIQAKMKSRHP